MRFPVILAALCVAALSPAHAATFLAPALAAPAAVSLDAPLEKKAAGVDDSGRLRASDVQPWDGAVRIGAIVHFTESPVAKALSGSCTVPVNCSTNDAALDAAISRAKKSMMRLLFSDDGGSFVCTATLINTPLAPAP